MLEEEFQELVVVFDFGLCNLVGFIGVFFVVVVFVWLVFQVFLVFFIFNYVLLSDIINNSCQIYLVFVVFLVFMVYLVFKSSLWYYILIQDWFLVCVGVFLVFYGFFFYDKIVNNGGLVDNMDKWFVFVGIVILFEVVCCIFGLVMVIVVMVFLFYVFFGLGFWVLEVICWKGVLL